MGIIEAILAVIGLACLIVVALAWLSEPPASPEQADVAAPYRDGLQAAMHIQQAAEALEQQMFTEAARHMGAKPPAKPSGKGA
ncbi:MAG TPA: hypothetical protein VMD79_12420 [Solirubrobacteraceae bacterium]|nr:hypothetical protein [Solirubrobacteraceae bacterium]